MQKKNVVILWLLCGMLLAALLGRFVFPEKSQAFYTVVLLLLCCFLFFWRFEQKTVSTRRIVVIAVMTGVSVAGRFLFALVPGFKPVTAVVVITGMYLGTDAGFICGAFSAVISNFYFGQGPWTPFQMSAWGILGFLAAILAPVLKKNRFILLFYGVFAGIAYSFFMDIWTVLWYNGSFSWPIYLAALASAVPYTAAYAVSNVVFLAVLEKPIGRKMDRMKRKYGV